MLWEELVEEGKNGVHELDRLRKQQLLSVGDDNLRLGVIKPSTNTPERRYDTSRREE